jgi:hypothetical protein
MARLRPPSASSVTLADAICDACVGCTSCGGVLGFAAMPTTKSKPPATRAGAGARKTTIAASGRAASTKRTAAVKKGRSGQTRSAVGTQVKRELEKPSSQKAASERTGQDPHAVTALRTVAELLDRGAVTAKQVVDNLLAGGVRTAQAAELMRALAEALPASSRGADIDDFVWGPKPSRKDTAAARATMGASREEMMRRALEGALSRAEAAQWLGITPQAVSKRRESMALTALHRGREWYFPRWQFTDDDTLPGLHELVQRYPGTALALAIWATTPNAQLDDETPADYMRDRGVQDVLAVISDARGALW